MQEGIGCATKVHFEPGIKMKINEVIVVTELELYRRDERSFADKWYDQIISDGRTTRDEIVLSEGFNDKIEDLNKINQFIELQKQYSLAPTVGNKYAPVGFLINAKLEEYQIFNSETVMILVDIISPREFIFECNNKVFGFPYEHVSNFQAMATFFYSSTQEAEALPTLITLSLKEPNWNFKLTTINKDGIRNTKDIQ